MRVVILANNIDEVGGAQRVVRTLAEGFAGTHEVDLVGVTPHVSPHAYGHADGYTEHRLMGHVWPTPATDANRLTRRDLRASAVAQLRSILAQGQPGVIIVAQVWAMELLADAGHDGWIIVGQYHGSFAAAASGRDLTRVLTSYRDADAFLALTEEDAHAFERCGLNNVRVMPNPIGTWPEAVDPVHHVVGYLGRLSPEKGPDLLLDAWAPLAHDFPAWSLRIAGEGPLRDEITRRAATLPRVDVVPTVTDPHSFWKGVGVGVLPSRTEGLPVALAEAQANGIPCVATDCSSGVRFLCQGVLVQPGELATGLASLMWHSALRRELGIRGRAAMEQYRADAILARWEVLFANLTR
ncbi:MAG: glycosyltransferase family 4 protein [Actinobacteria bacterium]|nr:glycosyltransferase family 4 protein [Actinomycetota bacterium]